MVGEAVITGRGGDKTTAASIELSVRRGIGGYTTALTDLDRPHARGTQQVPAPTKVPGPATASRQEPAGAPWEIKKLRIR